MNVPEKVPPQQEVSITLDIENHAPLAQTVEPYCIYGKKAKWFLVGISAVAGFFRYVHACMPACRRRRRRRRRRQTLAQLEASSD